MSAGEGGAAGVWRDCDVPGCPVRAHGKPFCVDHLGRLPYVAQLLAAVKAGAATTIVAECTACGGNYDRQRSNARGSTCGPCRQKRDSARHRDRQREKRRAS